MARRRKPKTGRKTAAQPAKRMPEFSNRALAGLTDLADRIDSGSGSAKPQSDDRPQESAFELDTFDLAMVGVTPLPARSDRLPPEPNLPPAPSTAQLEQAEVMQALQELVDGERSFSIFETDEAIEGLADGVDPRILRRLKRGDFSVQDYLDLHGCSREQARPLVAEFLDQASADQKRCVLIIHGRGHGSKDKIPVLKLALRSWLQRSGIRKRILAFSTARPCDGGAGAIYVLLRKHRSG